MVETHFTLVRHGETDWNLQGMLQGHADPPLNDTGRRQAALVAARLAPLAFAACYASDLRRARETAEVILAERGGSVLHTSRLLRERGLGNWEGLTLSQVRERWPQQYQLWVQDRNTAPPGGERLEEMAQRATCYLRTLVQVHAGESILVVCHGGPIKALVCEALGVAIASSGQMWTGNCSITRVKHDRRGLVVLTMNDLCHLEGEAQP